MPLTCIDEYGLFFKEAYHACKNFVSNIGNKVSSALARNKSDANRGAMQHARPTHSGLAGYDGGATDSLVSNAIDLCADEQVQGAVQTSFGVVQMKLGAGLCLLSPVTFGASGVLGGVLIVRGVDNCAAGVQRIAFDRSVETLTSQGLQSAGMTREMAEAVLAGVDVGSTIAGVAKVASLASSAGMAVKNAPELGNKMTLLKKQSLNGEAGVVHVTETGVALPKGAKYEIPKHYVQNPYRSGSYGIIKDKKFLEHLRIDSATNKGFKGPNYSHYHLNGKGSHFSPVQGDLNPGF